MLCTAGSATVASFLFVLAARLVLVTRAIGPVGRLLLVLLWRGFALALSRAAREAEGSLLGSFDFTLFPLTIPLLLQLQRLDLRRLLLLELNGLQRLRAAVSSVQFRPWRHFPGAVVENVARSGGQGGLFLLNLQEAFGGSGCWLARAGAPPRAVDRNVIFLRFFLLLFPRPQEVRQRQRPGGRGCDVTRGKCFTAVTPLLKPWRGGR